MESALGLVFYDCSEVIDMVMKNFKQGVSGSNTDGSTESKVIASVSRAYGQVHDGKWLESIKRLDKAATGDPAALLDTKILRAYCCIRLGGFEMEMEVSDALTYAQDHSLAHLVRGMLCDAQAQIEANEAAKMTLRRQAYGLALVYVTHPDSTSFPNFLRQSALDLLRSHGPVIDHVSAANPPRKPTQEVRWKEKVARFKSKALNGLMDLTGLEAVKGSFFELRDMIDMDKERGMDIKAKQYSCLFYGNPGTGQSLCTILHPRGTGEGRQERGVNPAVIVDPFSSGLQ